jgi:hypothetical protein
VSCAFCEQSHSAAVFQNPDGVQTARRRQSVTLAREQRRRNVKAKGLGGREVDNEIELGRLLAAPRC